MNSIFNTNDFTLQVIATGSFLDNDPAYNGKVFEVETATVRLNHIALNEWIDAQAHNCRDCYDTHEEWMDYLAMKRERRNAFNAKVAAAVGFPDDGISVAQVVSEVFAITYIHEA